MKVATNNFVTSNKIHNGRVHDELVRDGLITVLQEEANSILYLIDNFPKNSLIFVEKAVLCKGRVIFTGMGKSGHIGKKLAATFSSIGIPAYFLHPAEALHGDLGIVTNNDLIVALSKSGSGPELSQILPILKKQGNYTILISCEKGSLVKEVDLSITLPLKKEACLLNLAPTSSSTLMLAFGDAVGIVASSIKGFNKEEFAKFHPGGSLGKTLLLDVGSFIEHDVKLPFLYPGDSFKEVVLTITAGKKGVGIVTDHQLKPLGIITDGDLRRSYEKSGDNKESRFKACDIMTPHPRTISSDTLAITALEIIEYYEITSLLITENEKVVGLIHIHDIIKAGIKR